MEFGNFTLAGLIAAAEMLLAAVVAMSVREWARATVATRLRDPTPRLWGRVTFDPRAWFDPFGSGVLPGLVAILWAVGGVSFPIAAYAKPAPIDPTYFRTYRRDSILVSLAGPVADLILGMVAAIVLGSLGQVLSGELTRAVAVFAWVHCSLAVFHLIPIPGLDGARMLALALPPHPREIYRNGDKYLALWVLLAIFVLGFLIPIQGAIAGAVCDGSAGVDCLAMIALPT
jgi:Zn-dependent protease